MITESGERLFLKNRLQDFAYSVLHFRFTSTSPTSTFAWTNISLISPVFPSTFPYISPMFPSSVPAARVPSDDCNQCKQGGNRGETE
jgi:hypothetical protein